MKVFTIAGWSGSGKTTLITRLIEEFKRRGRTVAAVKRAPHKYYLEPESSDTFKFLEAGADEVCLAATNEILMMKRMTEQNEVFDFLDQRVPHCDVLLLEGLRRDDIPLIEVFDSSRNDALKFPLETLSAVVSDKPVTDAIPNFNRDRIEDIIHFMEVNDG